MSKKLDKRTLKWAAKQIRKCAAEAASMSKPRKGFDSTTIASPQECLARSIILNYIADIIREGKK